MGNPQNAIELLEEMKRLMELKGENPFKIRAFEKAATQLAGRDDLETRARAGTLTEIEGVGKGIAEVLKEFLLHGRHTARDELAASIPPALIELTEIPGLGPKKAMLLIDELGIQSAGELEYACRENRLLRLKGFGPKIQAKILEGIQFRRGNEGKRRIDQTDDLAARAFKILHAAAAGRKVSEAGALRRKVEILSELDFLVELPGKGAAQFREKLEQAASRIEGAPKVRVFFAEASSYGFELARLSGTQESWKALGSPAEIQAATEEDFFAKLGLPWIPPETRESGEEVQLARSGALSKLLPWDGVRGIFHNHTVYSDGSASVGEMVAAAEELGYEYIGISDHSQSAFYAHGVLPDDLKKQEKEIRAVQERHPGIRVFWGIESDILADGSLDYDEKVLARFDFVVASIHSRFQMDREAMTERILHAIRNPATRFLGHPTGRLLLGRKGYDLDMERVILEAAQHGVALEINSNPARLDLDWRWGGELRKRGALVSVNPDAHEPEGLKDTRYGIAVARKALLPRSQVVNSLGADEVGKWLKRA